MKTQQAPRVRIVTVAYNPGHEFERYLASLESATSLETTSIVWDNGTDHSVVDRLCAPTSTRVLRDGINHGYGTGINRATRLMDEDYLVIANPDVVFTPGSIDVLIDALHHDSVGAAGPMLLNPDGSIYPSARALPTLSTGIGHALFGEVWPDNPWSSQYRPPAPTAAQSVGWLSGACIVMRREVWESLGGFDEGYFMFFEDVDLGRRVGMLGLMNLYVPYAVVHHEQGATWKKQPEVMIRAHHASARRYVSRVNRGIAKLPVRVALSVGLRVREEVEVRAARHDATHA